MYRAEKNVHPYKHGETVLCPENSFPWCLFCLTCNLLAPLNHLSTFLGKTAWTVLGGIKKKVFVSHWEIDAIKGKDLWQPQLQISKLVPASLPAGSIFFKIKSNSFASLQESIDDQDLSEYSNNFSITSNLC